MYLAAIIMYTFDLSLVVLDSKPEDNFYFRLNQAPSLPPPHTLMGLIYQA